MEKIELKGLLSISGDDNFTAWKEYRPMTSRVSCSWTIDKASLNVLLILAKTMKRRNRSEFVNELIIRGLKDLEREYNESKRDS